ncbi:hypothetical protein VR44_34255 [Streptomyces katrae]|uniref:Uncharacterized protein n=1 Tax=Streptomyces katrae TaxID=68223 RepID=A0A0F4IS31_9ACTN|nr:hypothetical protein VR44_34255 [Streptomyces katrae]
MLDDLVAEGVHAAGAQGGEEVVLQERVDVEEGGGARWRWPCFHSQVYSRKVTGPYFAMRSVRVWLAGADFVRCRQPPGE